MKKLLTICLFIALSITLYAQQNFQISGTVKDKSGLALPGAGLYISGYKIATVTNDKGNYVLNLKPGSYDVLVQMVGFKTINKNLSIIDKSIQMDFVMEDNVQQLGEITVKPDPDYLYNVSLFKRFFIGTTSNSEKCKILNPQVLLIDYDKKEGKLNVTTNEFLIIENQALGYKIKYLIKDFEYNTKTKIVYFEGYPTYEDLPGSKSKQKKWDKARLEAYNGSPQHFFTALFNGTSQEEGFVLYKIFKKKNTDRPSDSIIKANIKRFSNFGNSKTFTLNDSLSYWAKKKREPETISILNRAPILTDSLVKPFNQSIKSINFQEVLYVMYTKEKEEPAFEQANLSISRPLDIPNYQVSLINQLLTPIYFFYNGSIYDPKSMLYEGYWAWQKIADSVPMDYLPPKSK